MIHKFKRIFRQRRFKLLDPRKLRVFEEDGQYLREMEQDTNANDTLLGEIDNAY